MTGDRRAARPPGRRPDIRRPFRAGPPTPTADRPHALTVVAAPRSMGVLLLSFGGLALLLGGIGTYGLVAYGVESRRQEFAVRLAIGAGQGTVMRLVLREGVRLALVGVAVGVTAALALMRLLEGLLFEVAPTDPVSFAVAPAVLLVTALAACAIPAWRATRVDPSGTLRS